MRARKFQARPQTWSAVCSSVCSSRLSSGTVQSHGSRKVRATDVSLLITADRVISYAIANDIVPNAEKGESGTRRVLTSSIDDSLLQEQSEIQARVAKLLREELPMRLSAPSARDWTKKRAGLSPTLLTFARSEMID